MRTEEIPPEPVEAPPRRRPMHPGRVLRITGRTFLTAAFLVAAYVAWVLWGTGIYTARQQGQLRDQLRERIAARQADSGPGPPVVLNGQAVGILKIPSIDLNRVVVEGTDTDDLKKGPGHYEKTSYPWADHGRVGIAGHRTTYGAPFWDLDRVRRGDEVLLRTEAGTFAYRVTGSRVVLPTQTEVLHQTGRPSLVLTTCTPRFSAAQRLIVIAERVTG